MNKSKKDEDYDLVVYKVPKIDKNGKEISGDKVGSGGRRRDDGTLSSMAYDPVVLDDEAQRRLSGPKRYEDYSLPEQVVINAAEQLTYSVMDYASYKVKEGLEIGFNFLKGKWHDHKRAKEEKRKERLVMIWSRETTEKAEGEKKNQMVESNGTMVTTKPQKNISTTDESFESTYEQYRINMTSEEAQKELIDIFVLTIMREKKMQRLRHAQIQDASGQIVDGSDLVKKLADPSVIKSINSVLEKNPGLLGEMQETYLTEVLGRELIVNSRYVPIESVEIDKVFTV